MRGRVNPAQGACPSQGAEPELKITQKKLVKNEEKKAKTSMKSTNMHRFEDSLSSIME